MHPERSSAAASLAAAATVTLATISRVDLHVCNNNPWLQHWCHLHTQYLGPLCGPMLRLLRRQHA